MKIITLKNYFLLLFVMFFSAFLNANQKSIDSLLSIWKNQNKHDTIRCEALSNLAYDEYLFSQPDSGYYYAVKLFEFADKNKIDNYKAMALNIQGIYFIITDNTEKGLELLLKSADIKKHLNDISGLASSYNNIGVVYKNESNFEQALYYYNKALKIYISNNDIKGIAGSLNNIGNIYNFKGDYARAITSYLKSLKYCEQINDESGIASNLNNIGLIYQKKHDYDKALDYFIQSLEIEKKLDHKKGIAVSYNSIGSVYEAKDNYYKAFEYYEKSLEIEEEVKNEFGMAESYNNIANLLRKQGNYGIAYVYYNKALNLLNHLDEKKTLAHTYKGLGYVYLEKKDYNKAKLYGEKALSISKDIGTVSISMEALYLLYKSYKNTGKYKNALHMHEQYITFKDSLNKIEKQEEIIKQEYQYKYDKKTALDSIKNAAEKKIINAELKVKDAEIKYGNTVKIILSGGLFLVLIFSTFLINRYILIKKQKSIITKQKQQVSEAYEKTNRQKKQIETAHKEITDSIKYAKRIQKAILPTPQKFKSFFSHSFVFYKPKDVVSGDFYWIEEKNNKIIFAVADCTGHGVPGAMVSVICNNGLNRAVREYEITTPGEILNKTREIVISEFEKSNEEVKDGMDIAICTLKDNVLEFSGANNHLILIRNNELITFKGDKQPIGKIENFRPFNTQTVNIKKGDSIYLYTDGYIDQFGGEKNKKFMTKRLKTLLLSIQYMSMDEQLIAVKDNFYKWKGNNEQIDDICLVGIKIL